MHDVQTCTTLPTSDQIVERDAVRISRFHNVEKFVFDVLHVNKSAHNYQSLSADGAKKIVDIEHSEEPGGRGIGGLEDGGGVRGQNVYPRFLRSSSLKKYFMPLGVERCSHATWNSQYTLKSISPPKVWLS